MIEEVILYLPPQRVICGPIPRAALSVALATPRGTMLSDATKYKMVPKKRRGVHAKGAPYAESQKLEAVTTYLILGNLTLVASALKININTLKLWKKSEWWKEIEQELRIQEDLQLSKRMQQIVSKSLDVMADRLENGNFIYDQRSGELKRKPVDLRDANKVLQDVGVRRDELLDRHVQNESVTTDKVENMLENLAKEFAKIASKVNKGSVEVTDVIFGDDENAKDEQGRDS
jgi:hypothetical protein